MSKYILQIQNVTKEFPGVRALDKVNVQVEEGTIHGLVGENGAGKSTLMKILSGVYPHGEFQGDIIIGGQHVKFSNVRDSEKKGVGIIYQELMLFPELSIAENILVRRCGNIVNWERVNEEALKWMQLVGLDDPPETLVKNIGVGKQQLVEIAKALSLNTKILILDEPTAALTEKEVEHLLERLQELKKRGVTCIYISHKLVEVMNICDEVTVLRDGKTISTNPIGELDENKIISKMVGRDFTDRFPPREPVRQNADGGYDLAFELKNWNLYNYNDKQVLRDISFQVRKGEILGIAGLMGAGRTELVSSLFGDAKGSLSGEMYINGKLARIKKPSDAIKEGLGLVTEDRKFNGLNLIDNIENNVIMPSLKKLTKFGVVNQNESIKQSRKYTQRVKVKAPSLETLAKNLSGGNQQKVIIAKWLMVNPQILMFDEPTRGIDVGVKYEIYNIMNELKRAGITIIMVSSELPEILGMSDRIIVLRDGAITGEFENDNITEEMVMQKASWSE